MFSISLAISFPDIEHGKIIRELKLNHLFDVYLEPEISETGGLINI